MISMEKEPVFEPAGSKLEAEHEISWPEVTLPTKFLSLQEPEFIKYLDLDKEYPPDLIKGFNKVIELDLWKALLEPEFKAYFGSRQGKSFLRIATYIQQLNKEGICPKILEVGCGSSFRNRKYWPFDTLDHLGALLPICSRTLGMFKEVGILDIEQIAVVDPYLLEPVEEKFGLTPYGVAIYLDHSGLNDLTLLDEKHCVKDLSATTFKFEAFRECKVDKAIISTFRVARTKEEVRDIINQNIDKKIYCLGSRGYKIGEPDPIAAKEILNNGPYDIVFCQYSNFLYCSCSIPLVRNGGIFWPDPGDVNYKARQVTYL